MPRLAFIFPGQGAQRIGMGQELAHNFPEAAKIFEQADDRLGFSISDLCFAGPKEKLDQTEYSQPALLTTEIAVLEVIKKHGIQPEIMAGLSLGEYSALVGAKAMTLDEALPLVKTRGALMQNAVPFGQGAMAAVLGMKNDIIEAICKQISGTVNIANYNAPGQIVISGEAEAVAAAGNQLKEQGAKVVPLAISVPSHSPLMYQAALSLKPYLEQINWQEPLCPVVSNVNAVENTAADFTELLVKQLYSPVKWEQSVNYMLTKIDYFIEIGPGSSLSGIIKRINRNAIIGQIEDMKSLEKVLAKVGSL